MQKLKEKEQKQLDMIRSYFRYLKGYDIARDWDVYRIDICYKGRLYLTSYRRVCKQKYRRTMKYRQAQMERRLLRHLLHIAPTEIKKELFQPLPMLPEYVWDIG